MIKYPVTILFILLIITNATAQLSYKQRTLGFGIHYDFPLTLSSDVGNNNFLRSSVDFAPASDNGKPEDDAYTFAGQSTTMPTRSYTLGAFLSYRHSIKEHTLITFEAGFLHSRILNFFKPTNGRVMYGQNSSYPIQSLHDWYSMYRIPVNFQLGLPLGKSGISYWYFKAGASADVYTNKFVFGDVASPLDNNTSNLLMENGNTLRGQSQFNPSTRTEGAFFSLDAGMGLQFHLGKYGNNVFKIGLNYRHNLEPQYNRTLYLTETNLFGQVVQNQVIKINPNFMYIDFSYSIPLIKSKKPRGYHTNNTKNQDSDGDGYKDKIDKCPYQYSRTNSGCPVKDTDGDGYDDSIDKCPNQYSTSNNGCPVSTPTQPNTQPLPSSNPAIATMEKDMNQCFGSVPPNTIKWYESPIKANSNDLEINFYNHQNKADGEIISVCINGKQELKSQAIDDLGATINYKIPQGKKEVIIIVKIENEGATPGCDLGIDLLKGGSFTLKMSVKKGDYWWFQLQR